MFRVRVSGLGVSFSYQSKTGDRESCLKEAIELHGKKPGVKIRIKKLD